MSSKASAPRLFDGKIIAAAALDAFRKLNPRLLMHNPVIFVTEVVAGLVTDGLVDKRPAPQDRRVQILTLTPQGRKAFRAMAERHETWIAELFAGLDQPEIGQLFRLLGETKTSLHRAIAGRAKEVADEAAKGDA